MLLFWVAYFFFIGALLASFYNVVGIRVLDNESILRRSRCPKCNNQLRWIDIIPLIGFTINRGKCHFCKEKIHIKYLLIELFGGLLYGLSFLLNYNYSTLTFDYLYFILLIFLFALIMMTIICYYEHSVILKKVNYAFLAIMILLRFIQNINILDPLIGAAICILFAYLLSLINPRVKQYFVYSAILGASLGSFGSLLLIVLFLLFKLFTLKKNVSYIYSISLSCIISAFASNYIFEFLTKILS